MAEEAAAQRLLAEGADAEDKDWHDAAKDSEVIQVGNLVNGQLVKTEVVDDEDSVTPTK